jgi:hypothetical protein
MTTTRTHGVAATLRAEGSLPALRALAARLSRDLDAAEYAADVTRLAHALRAVLATLHALDDPTAGVTPARPANPLDELLERRRHRDAEPPEEAS